MNQSVILYILLSCTILGWGIWGYFSKLGIGSVGAFVNIVVINVVNAVTVTLLGYLTLSRSSMSIESGLIHPIIGGIAMGIGTVTYFMLIEQYDVSLILPLTILYLVVTLGLSIVFLHEQIKLVQIVGIVLMMIATFLLSL